MPGCCRACRIAARLPPTLTEVTKWGGEASKTGHRQADTGGGLRGRSQGWEGSGRDGSTDGGVVRRMAHVWHRQNILSPNVVMTDRVRGVPKVTQETVTNRMDTERTMNGEGNVKDGGCRRDLERSAPLGAVGGFLPELLKDGAGISGHDSIPAVLRDIRQTRADSMGSASYPPGNRMIQAMAVSWHTNDRSWMPGLPKTTV